MATTVKETFRQFLPGAGRDVSGQPKQGKTRVVGQLDVTSYSKGGESLKAEDIRLTKIDAINLRVREEIGSGSGQQVRQVVFSPSAEQFYLFIRDHDGDFAERAAASTETVEYVAEGDSAFDVELL